MPQMDADEDRDSSGHLFTPAPSRLEWNQETIRSSYKLAHTEYIKIDGTVFPSLFQLSSVSICDICGQVSSIPKRSHLRINPARPYPACGVIVAEQASMSSRISIGLWMIASGWKVLSSSMRFF